MGVSGEDILNPEKKKAALQKKSGVACEFKFQSRTINLVVMFISSSLIWYVADYQDRVFDLVR